MCGQYKSFEVKQAKFVSSFIYRRTSSLIIGHRIFETIVGNLFKFKRIQFVDHGGNAAEPIFYQTNNRCFIKEWKNFFRLICQYFPDKWKTQIALQLEEVK